MADPARWFVGSGLFLSLVVGLPPHAAAQPGPAAPGDDIAVNGSFESPDVGGTFVTFGATSSLGAWTVASGSVDLINSLWTSAEGGQSLDLSGTAPGSIYQDLRTEPGKRYHLIFSMAGNFIANPAVKSLQVFWNGASVGVFTHDVTGRTATDMGWTTRAVGSLVATGPVTRLAFLSTTPTAYGPALDDVHVVEDADLVSLTLAKTLVAGCLKTSGKVTLNAPAPAGGVVVTLSSTNPKTVVPGSITLKEGVTSKRFPIATAIVGAREDSIISASTPGTTRTATLTLRPMGTKKVTLTPASLVGGTDAAGTVLLECPAGPGDITVTLWSTKPGAAVPDVTELVVPQGAPSAGFGVTTFPVVVVAKPSIKARANGVTKARALVVTPPAP